MDRIAVLEAATRTFWRLGYDGASLGALTAATGVSRPTLYSTFGDKADLFDAVLDHYGATVASAPLEAFEAEADIVAAATAFLRVSAENNTQPGGPSGCLLACCAATAAECMPELRARLRRDGGALEDRLAARFAKEAAAGTIAPEPLPTARATRLIDFMQAQAVRARSGATRAELLQDLANRAQAVVGAQH